MEVIKTLLQKHPGIAVFLTFVPVLRSAGRFNFNPEVFNQ